MIRVTIPGTLVGYNDYNTLTRCNRYKAAKKKKEMEDLISLCIKKDLKKLKFVEPVFVKFIWVEPNKRRDKDNIAFAKKFIFDALVKTGTLENDNWEWVVGFSDYFLVDKDNPRIELEIRTVDK